MKQSRRQGGGGQYPLSACLFLDIKYPPIIFEIFNELPSSWHNTLPLPTVSLSGVLRTPALSHWSGNGAEMKKTESQWEKIKEENSKLFEIFMKQFEQNWTCRYFIIYSFESNRDWESMQINLREKLGQCVGNPRLNPVVFLKTFSTFPLSFFFFVWGKWKTFLLLYSEGIPIGIQNV